MRYHKLYFNFTQNLVIGILFFRRNTLTTNTYLQYLEINMKSVSKLQSKETPLLQLVSWLCMIWEWPVSWPIRFFNTDFIFRRYPVFNIGQLWIIWPHSIKILHLSYQYSWSWSDCCQYRNWMLSDNGPNGWNDSICKKP